MEQPQPQPTKPRYNLGVLAAQEQFLKVVGELHEATCLQARLEQRETVLCDLTLHTSLQSGHQHQPLSASSNASVGPLHGQPPPTPALTAALELSEWSSHECSFCPATGQQHQHQQPDSSPDPAALDSLPDSYVSRLLRAATQQQIEQVSGMAAQDWRLLFTNLTPQLLLLLEMAARHPRHAVVSSAQTDRFVLAHGRDACGQTPHNSPDSSQQTAVPAAAADSNCGCGCGRGSAAAAPRDGAAGVDSPLLSSSSSFDTWLPHQAPPLGVCPVQDLRQLLQAVDEAVTLVLLALVHSPVPFLQACVHSYSSAAAGLHSTAQWWPPLEPSVQHWQLVTQQLQLREEQELQLSVCMDEYRRVTAASRQRGAELEPHIEATSLLLATEAALTARSSSSLQQQQWQQQQRGLTQHSPDARGGTSIKRGRAIRRAAGGAAASSAAGNAGGKTAAAADSATALDRRLQQYVELQHLHLLSLSAFVINTLSQTQLAAAFAASYPFPPDFLAIAAAASSNLLLRQRQQLERLQADSLDALARRGAGGEEKEVPAAGSSSAARAAGRARSKAAAAAAAEGPDNVSSASASPGEPSATVPQRSDRMQSSLLQLVTEQHVKARGEQLQASKLRFYSQLQAGAVPCDQLSQKQGGMPLQHLKQQQQHQQIQAKAEPMDTDQLGAF